jgi:hypothetical protein
LLYWDCFGSTLPCVLHEDFELMQELSESP